MIPRKNEAFLKDKDELPYIKPQQWVPVSFLMPDAMKNGGPCSWYTQAAALNQKGTLHTDAFDEKLAQSQTHWARWVNSFFFKPPQKLAST